MDGTPAAHLRDDLVDGVTVVEVVSRTINQPHLAQELGAELDAVLDSGGSKRLLLDFSETRSMSRTVTPPPPFGRRDASA